MSTSVEILHPIDGRRAGINADGDLVLNKPAGTQLILVGGLALRSDSTIVSALANSNAINAALAGGGVVSVAPNQGDIYISKTLLPVSKTRFSVGPGTRLRLTDSANCNMVRNLYSANAIQALKFVRASNVVSVFEYGHSRVVGDRVYIGNLATDTSFNGTYVVATVNGQTWTYVSAGSNGSPTLFAWIYNANAQFAAASFTRTVTSATVTWTSATPGVCTWTAHGRAANDPVVFTSTGNVPSGLTASRVYYVAGSTITTNTFSVAAYPDGPLLATSSTGTGTITGAYGVVAVSETAHTKRVGDPVYVGALATDTSFNGSYFVSAITASTWSYVSPGTATGPTGTGFVLASRDIEIFGGEWYGNGSNQNDNAGTQVSTFLLQCVGGVSIHDTTFTKSTIHNVCAMNCADQRYRDIISTDGVECLQFEGCWDRVEVQNISHNGTDDTVAFTQTANNVGIYDNVSSPFGISNAGNASVRDLWNVGGLVGVKICGTTGYSLGNITVDGVYGFMSQPNGKCVAIVDDTAGDTGGSANMIRVKNLYAKTPQATGIKLSYTMSGTVNMLEIDGMLVDGDCVYGAAFSGTTGTINQLILKAENWRVAPGVVGCLFNPTAMSIGAFFIEGGNWVLGNSAIAIQVYAAVIEDVFINDTRVSGVNSGGANGNNFFMHQTGTIKRCHVTNFSAANIARPFYQIGTATVGAGLNIYNLANAYFDTCGVGLDMEAGSTLNCVNVTGKSVVNDLFQVYTGTHRIVGSNISNDVAGQWVLFAAGSISVNAPTVQIDLTAATASGFFAPVAGDQVYNTQAAFGTGVGLYGRTAAPAWTKIF
jgi:hypothetical protein